MSKRDGSVGRMGGVAAPLKEMSHARAVGSFVPKVTRKAMEKYGFSAAALITDWAVIVGADIASYSEPRRLKWPRMPDAYSEPEASGRPGATLELAVSAARALDVQYKARQIVERINCYFGYSAVAQLRLLQMPVGEAREPAPTPRRVVAQAQQRARGRTSVPADLSPITDDGLRAALEKLQRNLGR